MKNILLLTPIYPTADLSSASTRIVHYFAKEWQKQGYKVYVVHYSVNFPSFLYLISKPFQKELSSFFGTAIRFCKSDYKEYDLDGVKIKRIPLKKYFPHTRYTKKQINIAYNKTIEHCNLSQFEPDVIISHWVNPQLEIMNMLKEYFKVPTVYVSHDIGRDLKTIYKKEAKEYLNNIDVFGFRSKSIKHKFENYFGVKDKSFICYSGIPTEYVNSVNNIERDFTNIEKFIFVGSLIKRKYPAKIISPIINSSKNNPFQISYIGTGFEEKTIKKIAYKNNVNDKIKLLGRLDRDIIINHLKKHEVFIMISENETFGLVYLEAMACGCIVIASKNEGFDGIIKHGQNGFLCNAGDEKELESIIIEIKAKSNIELKKISENAISTAKNMTDDLVAERYINTVIDFLKK